MSQNLKTPPDYPNDIHKKDKIKENLGVRFTSFYLINGNITIKSLKQGQRNTYSSATFRFTAIPYYQAQALMAAPTASQLQIMQLGKIMVGGVEGRVEEIPVDETIRGETIAREVIAVETPAETLTTEEAPTDESA